MDSAFEVGIKLYINGCNFGFIDFALGVLLKIDFLGKTLRGLTDQKFDEYEYPYR